MPYFHQFGEVARLASPHKAVIYYTANAEGMIRRRFPPECRNTRAMGLIKVEVWDATGTKRQEVQMPDDAPVNRLLVVLLEKLNFPMYAPDGQPLSYKLHHRSSGKQLLDEQTLGDVG